MCIAIEYSYKLGHKNEFKFLCKLGWFLQRQSHIIWLFVRQPTTGSSIGSYVNMEAISHNMNMTGFPRAGHKMASVF